MVTACAFLLNTQKILLVTSCALYMHTHTHTCQEDIWNKVLIKFLLEEWEAFSGFIHEGCAHNPAYSFCPRSPFRPALSVLTQTSDYSGAVSTLLRWNAQTLSLDDHGDRAEKNGRARARRGQSGMAQSIPACPGTVDLGCLIVCTNLFSNLIFH